LKHLFFAEEGEEKLRRRKQSVKIKRMREIMKSKERSGGTIQPDSSGNTSERYLVKILPRTPIILTNVCGSPQFLRQLSI
jgi:hypothetical protein